MSWVDGVRAVHAEAAGLLGLHVVMAADVSEIVHDALCGDPLAMRLFRTIVSTVGRVATAPTATPMLCATCPRPLRDAELAGWSLVVVSPETVDFTRCFGMGICLRCARKHGAVRTKAVTALRRIWPGARAIEIPLKGGRA